CIFARPQSKRAVFSTIPLTRPRLGPLPALSRFRAQSLSAHARLAPNKRLKLTGGERFKGSGVLCPWRGTDCRPTALRRRAGRPQLKRDPLGANRPSTNELRAGAKDPDRPPV